MGVCQWCLHSAIAVVVALGPQVAPGFAQSLGTQGGEDVVIVEPQAQSNVIEPAFGDASEATHVVSGLSFRPPNSATTWNMSTVGGVAVYQTTPPPTGNWWADVRLPAGALVTRIELEACDTSATGQILFNMASSVSPAGDTAFISPIAGTGALATPGCAFFPLNLNAPITIDNRNNNYWVGLQFGTAEATTRVKAVRVFYRLQVSPPPALATFADVPTSHPFFQYIEALKAAGITGGCAPNVYCPDAPITRGQMAVFIAKALGLHFPN